MSQQGRQPGEVRTSQADPGCGSLAPQDDHAEAERTICEHCEREWPNDYSMRSFCVRPQREALDALKRGRPDDIPEEVFAGIRSNCAAD